ncbi:MAG: hypothetical protein COA79_20700 [Planctomycetota bacterium]|nr:MAG: hypothetical protein COA79_20700 [Planctomycetota bacterium]
MIIVSIELFIPLILANVIHMFIVKHDLFLSLKKPLNENLFGRNKTYRGLMVVTVLTAIFQLILSFILDAKLDDVDYAIGFILGLTYILCELPNSYAKRRLGIKPGDKSVKYKKLFAVVDKSDSTLGVCLVFVLIKCLGFEVFLTLFLSAFVIHYVISCLLVYIKVKESI